MPRVRSKLIKLLGSIETPPTVSLDEWVKHFEKITDSFLPKLFSYLQQPLLPRTNNELEIFISRLKKGRRRSDRLKR